MYLTCLLAKVHALQMTYLGILCEKYFSTSSCVFHPHTCFLLLISQIPIPDLFSFLLCLPTVDASFSLCCSKSLKLPPN